MTLLLLAVLLLVLFGGLGFLLHPLFWIGVLVARVVAEGGYLRGGHSHY